MLIDFAFAVRAAGAGARPAAALHLEVQDDIRRSGSVAGERMARREIHAVAATVDRRLQQLRQLDEQRDAVRRSRHAARIDARVLGRDQQPGGFAHRTLFSRRRRRHGQPRNLRHGLRQRAQLELVIQHDQHRLHRRGHRDLVGADRRFGERRQRDRLVVPFHAVAHDQRHVLGAVVRVHAVGARAAVVKVAGDDEHRNAIGVGVVDRHRRVLQTDVAVHDRQHRLAFDLGVAVRHGDRRLLVAARQQLRHLVLAVVDDRFVQPFEARARIGRDVLETDALDDIEHEVRRRMLDDAGGGATRRFGVRAELCARRTPRSRTRGCLRLSRGLSRGAGRGLRDQRGGAGSRAFQEPTTADGDLRRARHWEPPKRLNRAVSLLPSCALCQLGACLRNGTRSYEKPVSASFGRASQLHLATTDMPVPQL